MDFRFSRPMRILPVTLAFFLWTFGKYIPLDPNKLPHRTAEPTKKKPRTKPEEFQKESKQYVVGSKQGIKDSRQYAVRSKQGIGYSRQYGVWSKQEPILVASNGPLKGLLSPSLKPETRNLQPATPNSLLVASNGPLSGLLDSPLPTTYNPQPVLLAQADPPTDADLAETIEVQFTPAIIAKKAEELENNPVKIYNWVRNNIEFVPTYGSIQGADYCLQTLQCNAFDTASLLIALLRASGIHARYVYGTVEIPIDRAMNWVGNFSDPNSALSFIASGGIPVGGLTSGGKIVSAQLEHIWVKAWVDMIPSFGAIHKQGDTWVPMDASFKQYTYSDGVDLKTAISFDAQAFIDQIESTATINETEGYVLNVDSNFIQATMTNYQTQLENYIDQNMPSATIGDILGRKAIIQQNLPILAETLPFKTIVTAWKNSEMPDNLRYKIQLIVYKNDLYWGNTPDILFTTALPEIASKKLTLSYDPASETDEQVLISYASKEAVELPAYLINLKPVIRLVGDVVATGTSITMGNEQEFAMIFKSPRGTQDVINNTLTVGSYNAIVINPGKIHTDFYTQKSENLKLLANRLEQGQLEGLTKDDFIGEMLYAIGLGYWVQIGFYNKLISKFTGVAYAMLPSEGIFSNDLDVSYIFSTPVSAQLGGNLTDIDRNIKIISALDGDRSKTKSFMLTSGMQTSYLEVSIWQEFFGIDTQGISAAHALNLAIQQNIPIYQINSSNINTILPKLETSAAVKSEIQNAVNAGKEVTIPQKEFTIDGYAGIGYVVVDPETGSGAYMISGGYSGGFIKALIIY